MMQVKTIKRTPRQIIQLVHDPLQVTAVELPDVIGGRQLVPVLNTDHVAAAVVIFIRQDIIRPVSVAETVHEDLIHDAAGRPQRHLQLQKQRQKRRLQIQQLMLQGIRLHFQSIHSMQMMIQRSYYMI